MKKFVLLCFALLLFVTASAFENGGKQKFERDRFVLLEHSQVQTIVIATNEFQFVPVADFAMRVTQTSELLITQENRKLPKNTPTLFVQRDVGWLLNSGVSNSLINTCNRQVSTPYMNYLRLYSCINPC